MAQYMNPHMSHMMDPHGHHYNNSAMYPPSVMPPVLQDPRYENEVSIGDDYRHSRVVTLPSVLPETHVKANVVEKIVEVPQTIYRNVPVEKIVEVPEVHTETITKEIVVPVVVEVPIIQPKQVAIEQEVERNIPVPIDLITVQTYQMPRLTPKYKEIPVPIYVPRYIEVPVPTQFTPVDRLEKTQLALGPPMIGPPMQTGQNLTESMQGSVISQPPVNYQDMNQRQINLDEHVSVASSRKSQSEITSPERNSSVPQSPQSAVSPPESMIYSN